MGKRMVVPDAFRITRLKPGRRFCVLGRISDEIGWKRKADVAQLEAARKEKGKVYWETKKALLAKQKKAQADTADGPYAAVLAQHGYQAEGHGSAGFFWYLHARNQARVLSFQTRFGQF